MEVSGGVIADAGTPSVGFVVGAVTSVGEY